MVLNLTFACAVLMFGLLPLIGSVLANLGRGRLFRTLNALSEQRRLLLGLAQGSRAEEDG